MESFDSSPNYMRATTSFDAKKENSPQGGSECDDIISVGSSTCGSATNNSGIKYRTNNKKTLKNFGSVRSFRRRAKPRIIQSPVTTSDDSLVGSSEASPHYLKATSCSQGKKTHSQISPRHTESSFDGSGKGKLASPSHKSLQTLSRTSSLRNVRFLMKKASFKPKRSLVNYSKVSEDVAVDRATYSSTLKDSKFPKPVELHPEPEKISAQKVCRYHHCSLHGHCHGSHDPAPEPKRFLYKRRWSLKKQRSIIPKIESRTGAKQSSDKKMNLKKSQITPSIEPLDQERTSDHITFSSVGNNKGVDSYAEIYVKEEAQLFGDGCGGIQESDLIEVAFGETSFPERVYQENLNILRKYSSQEQDFEGTSLSPHRYCLRCSCHIREQATVVPRRADAGSSLLRANSSILDNGDNNETTQNGNADVSDASSLALIKKPKEPAVSTYVEDISMSSCANEKSDKDSLETPVVSDEVTKKVGVFSSASYSQTSSDSNSEEEVEFTTESTPAEESKVNEVMQVKGSEENAPTQEGGKLQFSKQRHVSMWHLIHQHMSSNLAAEPANKPLRGVDGDSPANGANSPLAKEILTSDRELPDSDIGMGNNDSESQEIKIRKLFATKLVREAIEKILLPEVQDQTSDDQSVTSEKSPQPEFIQKNQNEACVQENYADSDANKGEGHVQSDPKEETHTTDDASGAEVKETEKKVVRKSEKKPPKHWSNLKKWILLQRFIRELEKVRKFNPKKPQQLPLNPDPEAEKINLRPQTVDERRSAEEWMLDYALRQAVNQLAPTQKRKVALLVKAFETVVPPQEDPQVQFRIPTLKDNGLDISSISNKADDAVSGGHGRNKEEAPVNGNAVVGIDYRVLALDSENQETGAKFNKKTGKLSDGGHLDLQGIHKDANVSLKSKYSDGDCILSNGNEKPEDSYSEKGEPSPTTESLILDGNGKSVANGNVLGLVSHPDAVNLEKIMADEMERPDVPTQQGLQEGRIYDCIPGKMKENSQGTQLDRKNHIKMWHMIYQHVISGIAEKVGSQLLGGAEDDEVEDNKSPTSSNGDYSNDFSQLSDDSSQKNHVSSNLRLGFTKSVALKLVKEAVDEILLPEIQDDSSDTQSVTSESVSELDISERSCSEIEGQNISNEGGLLMDEEGKSPRHDSTEEDAKAESQVRKKSELPKPKNWSKLKKLILLKRSIRALEKAGKLKPQPHQLLHQTPDPGPEKIDLRSQMMDERKKAEQWMLDYAVQHIVTKLTPSRKRRVSMLVEAFEAVVPLPEM